MPPLHEDGYTIKREGFLVPCTTDADCMSRCGLHPILGSPFVCTHGLRLYTYARIDEKTGEYSTIDEPGDDAFDPKNRTSEPGLCTDHHINYGNTGCRSLGAAQAAISVVGCTSRSFGFANEYCGAEMDIPESDFVSDVTVSEASLEYPRVLIPGAEVNGKQELPLTCADSLDCKRKCDYFAENAHDGGLPAPSACALCQPPCPSNVATSATDLAAAVSHDTAVAAELAAKCLGGAGKEGCLCAIFLIIKPTWLKIIDEQGSGLEQCKEGFDPFQLIAVEIDKMILNDFENNMNNFFIRPLNDLLGVLGPVEELCIPAYWDSRRCPKGDTFWEAALGCGIRDATPPHEQCYYKRVRSICMSERGDQYGKYKRLFTASSAESLSAEYASIAGEGAVEEMPPTLLAAFEQVDASKRSGIDDIRESQGVDPGNICDRMDEAMSLDEIILACVFRHVEDQCGADEGQPARFSAFIDTIDWEIPKVIFDWTGCDFENLLTFRTRPPT